METITITKMHDDRSTFDAVSKKGNQFTLTYECDGKDGFLFIKGGKRKAALKVEDILFWLAFIESSDTVEVEVSGVQF